MKKLLFITLVTCLLITNKVFADIGNTHRGDTLTVEVKGTDTNARFVPVVIEIQPGDVIQFVVREGLHTVSAYHPDNRRPLRIPETAESFDSGLLKAGDTWFLTIEAEGVYDYFCLPHERMGHVGRILSGSVQSIPDYPEGRIPEAALEKLNTQTTSF
jgi:plastocyanin